MDYSLLYSQEALNNLAEIVGHIAADDPEAASRFGRSFFGKSSLDHVSLLVRFPRMGHTIQKRSRVRKLVHSPILVYYRCHEDRKVIEILHLRHGSRKPPQSSAF